MNAQIVVPKRPKRDCTGADVQQGYLVDGMIYTFDYRRGDVKACKLGRYDPGSWQATGDEFKLSETMLRLINK